jgi:hypothetical protein
MKRTRTAPAAETRPLRDPREKCAERSIRRAVVRGITPNVYETARIYRTAFAVDKLAERVVLRDKLAACGWTMIDRGMVGPSFVR